MTARRTKPLGCGLQQAPLSPTEQSVYEYKKAPDTVGGYLDEVDVHGKTVLDFGCGWGGETLWLSEQGPGKVIGVDPNDQAIAQARRFCDGRVDLYVDSASIPDASVDFVFSTDVFEHVMDLPTALDEIHRVLRPGGALLSTFGPLFYSPYGCHFYWAKPFPWSHLILGRRWLKRRIDRIRGYRSETQSWEDMGLNRMTFEPFAKLVRERFQVERLRAVPVRHQSWALKVPGIKIFMTQGCDLHVVKSR